VTAFAVAEDDRLLVVVAGTDDQARLQVRLGADVVARMTADGVFGAGPELTAGLVEATPAADDSRGGLAARLRAAPGVDPPPGLGAVAATAWLDGDPRRRDAHSWLLAGWDAAAGPIRTIWDYVPLDGAGGASGSDAALMQSAALQFILDEHPELPIGLAELARAMSALELPGGPAPLEELAAVLSELGVANERLPDGGPLGFAMGDDQDQWPVLGEVIDSGWLVLYVELPESADAVNGSFADGFQRVAGINARLQVGTLLLDGDAGGLMYRAAVDVVSPLGRIGALRRLLDLVYADVQAVLRAWRDEA
jgi:hypothetical protein